MHSRKMLKAYLAFIACVMGTMPAAAHDARTDDMRDVGKFFVKVGRDVSPSVVLVHVESKSPTNKRPSSGSTQEERQQSGDDLLQQFIRNKSPDATAASKADHPKSGRMFKSQGSGFVFKTKQQGKSGKTYVLTSNHVVSGADKIRVQFNNGREFYAEVTGRDSQSDIAVLEITATGMPPLSWGDSSKLEVGEWVVAIGNPFGLSHSLSAGIVSAKGRSGLGINEVEDFIQTDAAINPGGAGGPLLNLNGKVVGISAAMFSSSSGCKCIGLAIPSNLAKTIAAQLIEQGKVTRGYLGIVLQQLTPDIAKSLNVPVNKGLLVVQINKDSPADKAGLLQGDVILQLGGEKTITTGSVRNQIALMLPDTRISVTILRNGKQQILIAKVGSNPTEKQVAK